MPNFQKLYHYNVHHWKRLSPTSSNFTIGLCASSVFDQRLYCYCSKNNCSVFNFWLVHRLGSKKIICGNRHRYFDNKLADSTLKLGSPQTASRQLLGWIPATWSALESPSWLLLGRSKSTRSMSEFSTVVWVHKNPGCYFLHMGKHFVMMWMSRLSQDWNGDQCTTWDGTGCTCQFVTSNTCQFASRNRQHLLVVTSNTCLLHITGNTC